MGRRVDHRRAKLHYSYTYEEAAKALGVHPQTVRGWRQKGLPVMTDSRVHLIGGRDLQTFLKGRRVSQRQRCQERELFCLKCRAPSKPDGGMVEVEEGKDGMAANLLALCERCGGTMRQRAGDLKIAIFRRLYEVTDRQRGSTLTDGP